MLVSKKNESRNREIKYEQDNTNDQMVLPIDFFMIGDLKFLFMISGRNGFSGSKCLYCMLKASQWKKQHQEKDSIFCGAEKLSVEILMDHAMNIQQPDARDNKPPLSRTRRSARSQQTAASTEDATTSGNAASGVKEPPIWTFIPIQNYLAPLLHLQLGLGNDLVNYLSHFWKKG